MRYKCVQNIQTIFGKNTKYHMVDYIISGISNFETCGTLKNYNGTVPVYKHLNSIIEYMI